MSRARSGASSAPDAPYLALLRLDAGHPVGARIARCSSSPIRATRPVDDRCRARCSPAPAACSGPSATARPATRRSTLDAARARDARAGRGAHLRGRARAAPKPAPRPTSPTARAASSSRRSRREIDGGRTPVKRVVGDVVEVEADIFTDGHDKIAAEILYRAAGETDVAARADALRRQRPLGGSLPARAQRPLRSSRSRPGAIPSRPGCSEIEKKRAAGVRRAARDDRGRRASPRGAPRAADGADGEALRGARGAARRAGATARRRSSSCSSIDAQRGADRPQRRARTTSRATTASSRSIADRLAARFSAWYELFPRSQSRRSEPARHLRRRHRDACPTCSDLGFDVLYFPPIHPIGTTNRKGTNNSLTAEPGDPGSVYAIGSRGGRARRHPSRARHASTTSAASSPRRTTHGLEIALDFAIQCSPDHPWIKRASGMVRLAARRHASSSPRTRRRNTRTSSTSTSTARRCPSLWHRAARRGAVLGRAGRAHLPRRQPAHQAAPVLGMADPRGERAPSRT